MPAISRLPPRPAVPCHPCQCVTPPSRWGFVARGCTKSSLIGRPPVYPVSAGVSQRTGTSHRPKVASSKLACLPACLRRLSLRHGKIGPSRPSRPGRKRQALRLSQLSLSPKPSTRPIESPVRPRSSNVRSCHIIPPLAASNTTRPEFLVARVQDRCHTSISHPIPSQYTPSTGGRQDAQSCRVHRGSLSLPLSPANREVGFDRTRASSHSDNTTPRAVKGNNYRT